MFPRFISKLRNKQFIWYHLLTLTIVLLFGLTSNNSMRAQSSDVIINVNPDDTSSWTINKLVFGKFIEHNGKDAYPGLYAQHLANSSFEDWFSLGSEPWQRRTAVLYRDTETYGGLAYPWEPHFDDTSSKASLTGGVHGARYQRIQVSGGKTGGIRQRTAIPDRRTKKFVLHLYVRGSVDSVDVRLETGVGYIADAQTLPLTSEWTKHTVTFDVTGASTSRYISSPFGQYAVGVLIQGDGYVDLDGFRLMSGDAVRGKYNPTTIELLKKYNVTSIRWPGGNWTSVYRWRDGVGPLNDRPVRDNTEWGGLEPNFMGTNEFLEFCEIAGITPYLNVGFNTTIGPEEAADWVEYVNGSTDTEMGQLRADHGHPEPYNVKHWQVGNETYGGYQAGHTDAEDFARRFVDHYEAMKAVDPDIRVIASGIDPLYVDHDENWNKTLFDIAGKKVDGVDIHRYVQGVFSDDVRQSWDEDIYHRNLVAFPAMYHEHVIGEVRQSASNRGRADMLINVGEFNLQPRVNAGWDRADYPTMAHAAFVAGMFNAFIKEGDAVQYSYMRDNTLFYRPYPIDMRPVNPGNYVHKYYAEPLTTGKKWHQVNVTNTSPTFFLEATGFRQKDTRDVSFVDASAIRSADGRKLYLFVTNRNLQTSYNVDMQVDKDWRVSSANQVLIHSSDPFNRQTSWTSLNGFSVDSSTVQMDSDNSVILTLPAASISRLEMEVADTATAIAGGDPTLPRKISLGQNYPNPFNPATSIPYALPTASKVTLEVFTVAGQHVATLVDEQKQAGNYTVTWDASGQSSGVYYYKLQAGEQIRIAPMTLIK